MLTSLTPLVLVTSLLPAAFHREPNPDPPPVLSDRCVGMGKMAATVMDLRHRGISYRVAALLSEESVREVTRAEGSGYMIEQMNVAVTLRMVRSAYDAPHTDAEAFRHQWERACAEEGL